MKTDNRILNTVEMCRITFEGGNIDGDYERLTKQTYNDGTAPFYSINHGSKIGYGERQPVETMNHDLQVIITHLEVKLRDQRNYYSKVAPANIKLIVEPVLQKESEFIDMIKAVQLAESVEIINVN